MREPKPQTFKSHSEQETADLAHRIAAALRGGEYISLEGDLGAGKTLFSRELARGLGINDAITSPTFVIQKSYAIPGNPHGITRLIHYDFYRITDYHELLDLGFEDHDRSNIVLAEWGNLFANEFPVKPIKVYFEIHPGDVRLISVKGLSSI